MRGNVSKFDAEFEDGFDPSLQDEAVEEELVGPDESSDTKSPYGDTATWNIKQWQPMSVSTGAVIQPGQAVTLGSSGQASLFKSASGGASVAGMAVGQAMPVGSSGMSIVGGVSGNSASIELSDPYLEYIKSVVRDGVVKAIEDNEQTNSKALQLLRDRLEIVGFDVKKLSSMELVDFVHDLILDVRPSNMHVGLEAAIGSIAHATGTQIRIKSPVVQEISCETSHSGVSYEHMLVIKIRGEQQ